MMNPVAEAKPTSEELRDGVNELRSKGARQIEQASRLMEKRAHLEDLISHRFRWPSRPRVPLSTVSRHLLLLQNLTRRLPRTG